MWRLPTDIPQTAIANGLQLVEVPAGAPLDEIFKHWKESGAVILKGMLTPDEADRVISELEKRLDSVQRGTLVPYEDLAAFHGPKTKRAGDLLNHSAIFRERVI